MLRTLKVLLILCVATAANADWEKLTEGAELGRFTAQKPSIIGNSQIIILRIDPAYWELVSMSRSQTQETENLTARQWADKYNFSAVINSGMFAKDYSTHVGYLQADGHINSSRVSNYQSVAAFGPKQADLPYFKIYDLDEANVSLTALQQQYSTVVQNLRLIKRPRENRWKHKKRMWSEAALGEDAQGRILFIHTRSPFTMHHFNEELLNLGIDLVAAQHLEGGPEAQLYFNIGGQSMERFGSYETAFNEDNANQRAWPIPNVLGVRQKKGGETPPEQLMKKSN
ncbi:phosphodiester glycosidase family protein [Marinicella sp. W31]|uniref:phosphodiester glycosidase family protein n=1 Tax=Marinicella sp. W31 TaxID=3023713 RepID=UPI0037568C77